MAKLKIIKDIDKSIEVMHNVGVWLKKMDRSTLWWEPKNMNKKFMLKHTEPNEYFCALIRGKPAASMILQETERNQSWHSVDGNDSKKALYLHWLCVHRDFSGQGLSKKMVSFAKKEGRKRGFHLLRLDTDADEKKLCSLYENIGFIRMGTEKEGEHNTAFYQLKL